ncbi:hypothetical protein CK215_26820 [Mesorhizobium sp. WSM3864]|nr:hypothetical protein CK215_26820 [Mesorhizobium sp. WSM3864]
MRQPGACRVEEGTRPGQLCDVDALAREIEQDGAFVTPIIFAVVAAIALIARRCRVAWVVPGVVVTPADIALIAGRAVVARVVPGVSVAAAVCILPNRTIRVSGVVRGIIEIFVEVV